MGIIIREGRKGDFRRYGVKEIDDNGGDGVTGKGKGG